MRKPTLFVIVGPGLLVAATGVGAGDLATAAFTGSQLGVAVLWAVAVGAFVKFILNEGLARWQLATGETLLEGCMTRLGRPFHVLFLVYLVSWSLFVGAALMGACGVTLNALVPLFEDPNTGKFWFGVLHSIVGVVLVLVGGFRLFEKVMGVCIGVMFVTVIVSAVRIGPAWDASLAGLFIPRIPDASGQGLSWTIALMGGVGGTLTVLCYGYWIREAGREGPEFLKVTRIDLVTAYTATALFGMAMVIIGNRTEVEGSGAGLIVALHEQLEGALGPVGAGVFLLGAWGAVFSSLLGVWQSVPYIFADFWGILRGLGSAEHKRIVKPGSRVYNGYLLALAFVPILALQFNFRDLQKGYALIGACFMPLVAAALIFLNGRVQWVGVKYRNKSWTTGALLAIILFFCVAGWFEVRRKLGI